MPLLYYWRGDNYRRDLDMGAGYHLNQANPVAPFEVRRRRLWQGADLRERDHGGLGYGNGAGSAQ
jgi:hypothetical protein